MSHSLIILFAFIQTPGARLVPCLKLVIQRTCHDNIGDRAKVVPRLSERGLIQLPFSNLWHLLSTFSCSQLHWRHLFRWQQVVAAFWLLMVVLFLFVSLFFVIVHTWESDYNPVSSNEPGAWFFSPSCRTTLVPITLLDPNSAYLACSWPPNPQDKSFGSMLTALAFSAFKVHKS